jgi:type I restriction enzyme R subunit
VDGTLKPGYIDMIEKLSNKFPLSESQIVGEQKQKDFISLFGAILRMRNLLTSFDEFKGKEMIAERDLQDYLGRYQDLRMMSGNASVKAKKAPILLTILYLRLN